MNIGIDLGTANVLVYCEGRGIVLREPSVVAQERKTKKTLAIGESARQMLGRAPEGVDAIRPLRDGVIADLALTEIMLKYFVSRVCGKEPNWNPFSRSKMHLVICVPAKISTVELRAVRDAGRSAGAQTVEIMEEPLAAAIGAGLPVDSGRGSMVVDIGGGTTDVAVIAFGGIVVSESLRIGGDRLDEAIIRYVQKTYNLVIGERTAEEIKVGIASAYRIEGDLSMEIRGRDLMNGLPKAVRITGEEVRTAIDEPIAQIVDSVKRVLEQTPPELSADIMEQGIVLTGGGGMLRGLDTRIAEVTGIPTIVAEDPLSCVALGTGRRVEAAYGAG